MFPTVSPFEDSVRFSDCEGRDSRPKHSDRRPADGADPVRGHQLLANRRGYDGDTRNRDQFAYF